MADERRGGGGFLLGAVVGGVVGYLLGSYLATEEGRRRVAELRQRAEEMANDPELRARAQNAYGAARDALGEALQEGVAAARDRRDELASTEVVPGPNLDRPGPQGGDAGA